jgi:hypothetical protein
VTKHIVDLGNTSTYFIEELFLNKVFIFNYNSFAVFLWSNVSSNHKKKIIPATDEGIDQLEGIVPVSRHTYRVVHLLDF